jgi:hypothetical protein
MADTLVRLHIRSELLLQYNIAAKPCRFLILTNFVLNRLTIVDGLSLVASLTGAASCNEAPENQKHART